MAHTLEYEDRHLYEKVIDRIVHKVDANGHPYMYKTLLVNEPMVIDDKYFARIE